MPDKFASRLPELDSPAENFQEVSPSAVEFAQLPRFLIVGGAGLLALRNADGATVSLTAQAGQVIPLRPLAVLPGTTATNIVVAW